MKLFFKIGIPIFLVAVFVWAIFKAMEPGEHSHSAAKTLKSPQQADAPLGLAVKNGDDSYIPEVDSRVHLYDGFTRVQIPVAEHFESPMGNENGAFSYNAQGFMEPNKKRGGFHLGDDLNGIGGMNSDLGDPIYAIADGLVVYTGEPSVGWGNVVVIAHKLRDGRVIQSFYAHLDRFSAVVGSLVGRGQKIGTVGNASGNYYAHLHFEMRESDGVHIGAGYSSFKESYGEQIDPQTFYKSYNQLSHDEVGPSALAIVLEVQSKEREDALLNQFLSSPIPVKE